MKLEYMPGHVTVWSQAIRLLCGSVFRVRAKPKEKISTYHIQAFIGLKLMKI